MIENATNAATQIAMRRARVARAEALRDVWNWLFQSRTSR
jgi:hypothetical protein